jgi:hypothetical protein
MPSAGTLISFYYVRPIELNFVSFPSSDATIVCMHAGKNHIGIEGGITLASALSQNRSLRSLSMRAGYASDLVITFILCVDSSLQAH